MKRLALLAALFACWGTPALAAPGFVGNLGAVAASGSAVTTQVLIVSGVDCPVGDTAIAAVAAGSGTAFTATDTAGGNSWTGSATTGIFTVTGGEITLLFAPITHDLAAPVTATGSITTTVVTFTTNPGTLVANQAVTGTGVTAGTQITGGISQWNGTNASATVNNSQSVVSETLTVSNVITFSWTSTTRPTIGAACFSGLSSTPFDLAAAGFNNSNSSAATSSPGIATGTLHPNTLNDLVIGELMTVSSHTGYTQGANFSAALNTATPGTGNSYLEWSYDAAAISTGVTYIPTWTTSRVFVVNVWAFKDAVSGGAVHCNRSLMGVGC